MKNYKLFALIFCFMLFSCDQMENTKTLATNEELNNNLSDTNLIKKEIENIEKLDEDVVANIYFLIELFKQKDIEKISNIISYPLQRDYPIPSIKNQDEFVNRFNEIFDSNLIDLIANSKIEQWSKVGLEGIMLNNGVIWITSSGELITTLNYQSENERKLMEDLIMKDKEKLHVSLKTFENPLCKIKTKTLLIRIDMLSENEYRYASWKIGKDVSLEPDLIIENGKLGFGGSGGNQVFEFIKGNDNYTVYKNVMGEGDKYPKIKLEVERNGVIIINEEGIIYE